LSNEANPMDVGGTRHTMKDLSRKKMMVVKTAPL